MKFKLFKKPKFKFDIKVPVYAHPSCIIRIDRKKEIRLTIADLSENIWWEKDGPTTLVYCNYGDELIVIHKDKTVVYEVK